MTAKALNQLADKVVISNATGNSDLYRDAVSELLKAVRALATVSDAPKGSREERASSWMAVWDLMSDLAPDLSSLAGSGEECVLSAIRRLATVSDASPSPSVQSISEQAARFAIDGAITFGRMGVNKPPSDDHWLMPFWLIGGECAKATQPAQPISREAQPARRSYCPEHWFHPCSCALASPAPDVRPSVPAVDEFTLLTLDAVAEHLRDAGLPTSADCVANARTLLAQPASAQGVSNEEMLRREIHNLKRHIEDYCQPAAPVQQEPLTGAQLDHIARSYFADEYDQQKVKHAISDAFTDAAPTAAQPQEAGQDDAVTVKGLPVAAVLEMAAHYAENGMKSTILAAQIRRIAPMLLAQAAPSVPDGWKLTEKANCYQLARGNEVVALLSGPNAEANAAKIASMLAAAPAPSVSADATLHRIADVFCIGSEARTPDTILANVENAMRRSECLSAVEREFFMVTTEADDDYPDEEPGDECLLNWGADPAEYVEQFRAAIAAQSQEGGAT